MTAGRERILNGIRRALGRDGPPSAEALDAIDRRLAAHEANLLPARTRLDRDAMIELFVEMAQAVDTTVARVAHIGDVPDEVVAYLEERGVPHRVKVAPHPDLEAVPWSKQPDLTVEFGHAGDADFAGVALAYAGIAESGTLFMVSGPHGPTTLNFLPDVHVVVLRAEDVIGTYEEAFARLRSERNVPDFMPRAVNWITGPSRTADIEQTLLLGVHGPRRLHVILVDGKGP
jgi:L-lactate dehydrogenase complex protein LldG